MLSFLKKKKTAVPEPAPQINQEMEEVKKPEKK